MDRREMDDGELTPSEPTTDTQPWTPSNDAELAGTAAGGTDVAAADDPVGSTAADQETGP